VGGCKGIITFAGQKKGMTFEQGMDLTVEFMNRVKSMLEDKGVTLCMENANSRYPDNVLGRADQLCDRPSWGFEMCKRVNSPNVKMLYDIYHAQIMEGNVVAAIRDNFKWIFHFHTAGVPGRHEIDETQELNYGAVCRAIAETGFKGYVAQEFVPTRDAMTSLRQAIDICDA
jgi:hydroxypyruvate isomerase